MTTAADGWQAGIDAVVADNTLNRGGFADAMRTVLTANFSNAEAVAWIDELAVEFHRLGLINNPTYNNLRGHIITDAAVHRLLFDALAVAINALASTSPASLSARLLDLREERDQIDGAIDRLDAIIEAEPSGTVGRLVKDVQRTGKNNLRGRKEELRAEIQTITGDPDS